MITIKNYKSFFVAALVFALLTAALAGFGYNSVAGMVPVTVASTNINVDEICTEKNVVTGQTPRGALQSDTVKNPVEIKGMVAKGYIPEGTVLRMSMFQTIQGSGVAAKLALHPGKVAVALPSDVYTTVGGAVKGDSMVAIYTATKGTVIKIIEKAPVLSPPDKTTTGGSAVLALTPQESEALFGAIGNREVLEVYLLPPENRS